jgi:hypothetical protein
VAGGSESPGQENGNSGYSVLRSDCGVTRFTRTFSRHTVHKNLLTSHVYMYCTMRLDMWACKVSMKLLTIKDLV